MNNADVKPSLIDLEAGNTATGGKQVEYSTGQSERLSEKGNMYTVYWIHLEDVEDINQGYIGITTNLKERFKAHKKNKRDTHFKNAILKYGWNNLIKDILHTNLTQEEALLLESEYRPNQNIGWNLQKGGELGVEKEWYDIEENRIKHSINTSMATKIGISLRDTKESRSKRAKLNWLKGSYKGSFKGSKNSRAILNEEKVSYIKCELIPKGMSDKEISIMYGVKPYVITWIRKGKNWKHVTCDSPDHK